ncbi:MAG: hypothetical protein AAB426_04385, partial [Myxococcota bacterium]
MSDSKVERVSKQQYLVYLSGGDLPQGLTKDVGGVPQTGIEKALSTDTRKVLTLTRDQVERLRAQGVKVEVNRPMSIPQPRILKEHKLTAAELSRMAGDNERIVPIAVKTHGADKLQAAGIAGQGVFSVIIDTGVAPHQDLPAWRIKHFYDVFAAAEIAPLAAEADATN